LDSPTFQTWTFKSLTVPLFFSHSQVTQKALSTLNEQGIKDLQVSLVEACNGAAVDIQKNVFRNYTNFVTIAREISNILFSYSLTRGPVPLGGVLNLTYC
jgi:hypothetical protein